LRTGLEVIDNCCSESPLIGKFVSRGGRFFISLLAKPKSETLALSTRGVAALIVEAPAGSIINVQGFGLSDYIMVDAAIMMPAYSKAALLNARKNVRFSLEQAGNQAELKLLGMERLRQIADFTVVYDIYLSTEMALVIDAEQCSIDLGDLKGDVQLSAKQCTVEAKSLTGSVDGDIRFSSLNLTRLWEISTSKATSRMLP